MDKIGYRDGYRKDFGRNDCFRNQGGIVRNDAAIANQRIAEKKPGKQAAQNKDRDTVGPDFRSELLRKEHGKYKRIADQQNQRMDHRPDKAPDRSDITML